VFDKFIFPEIKVIKEVENQSKLGEYKTLLLCKIDWSNFDEYKKIDHISWLYSICKPESQSEKLAVEEIIKETDWSDFHYPLKYKDVYTRFEYFKIPKKYLDEITHFKKLAIDEHYRQRNFDTIVRESCLEVRDKSVELFFYLISDSIFNFNPNLREDKDCQIINTLLSYRFWKYQTGRSLVISKCSKSLINTSGNLIQVLDKNCNLSVVSYSTILDDYKSKCFILDREMKINQVFN